MRQFTKLDIKILTTNFTPEETEILNNYLGWYVVEAEVTFSQLTWCKKLVGSPRVRWTHCGDNFLFKEEKDAFMFALMWGAVND